MKKSVKIIITFLCIVIVGLVTYIAVNKITSSKNNDDISEKKNNVVATNKDDKQDGNRENVAKASKSNESNITETEALEIANSTYKVAYSIVNNPDESKAFIFGEYDVNGKEANYKVDTEILKKYFSNEGLNKIFNISHFSKYNGEYYITENFVDFIPGIFGATDQGLRPLKIVSYTNEKINATGQITEGEGDHDATPLKIEFIKSGDAWLVNDFE